MLYFYLHHICCTRNVSFQHMDRGCVKILNTDTQRGELTEHEAFIIIYQPTTATVSGRFSWLIAGNRIIV